MSTPETGTGARRSSTSCSGRNETAVAKQLLAHGADVHARDKTGQTPLHAAAAFGDEGHVRLLLDHGAEIDARSVAGRTPLHLAAILGRVEEASFLVSRGADVSIRDRNGETPLHVALANVEKHLQEPFTRLLGGFMTAEVVEARPDALILRVESVHSKFPEAEPAGNGARDFDCPLRSLPRERRNPGISSDVRRA